MSEEIWMPVPGASIEASNQGRIRRNGILQAPHAGVKGYLYAYGKNKKCMRVHRAVLEAFVGPCPDGYQGAHLDGNKTNNHIENLKWTTPKENNDQKRAHGTWQWGERHGAHKLSLAQAQEIRARYVRGSRGENGATGFARRFGVNRRTVHRVISNESWVSP